MTTDSDNFELEAVSYLINAQSEVGVCDQINNSLEQNIVI